MNRHASSWFVYGLVVIASGCYRYFSRPDGEKGLYFGLVMGAIAIAAALAVRSGRILVGTIVGGTSLAFVLGWNLYESLVKNGGNHEPRLLLVAGISVVQAGLVAHFLRGARGARA